MTKSSELMKTWQVPGLSKFVLAPTRLLQDFFLDSAEGMLEQGQTLFCKVLEVDKEQEKLTVATSLKGGCWE